MLQSSNHAFRRGKIREGIEYWIIFKQILKSKLENGQTIEQINNGIIKAKESEPTLAGLTSTSKIAVWDYGNRTQHL